MSGEWAGPGFLKPWAFHYVWRAGDQAAGEREKRYNELEIVCRVCGEVAHESSGGLEPETWNAIYSSTMTRAMMWADLRDHARGCDGMVMIWQRGRPAVGPVKWQQRDAAR